ncbi:hypothetical protein KAR91_48080 [Candidatus Pacearchaeota archaeon]|nr:hypothetical protein [Candidatus Pacearchaeota archaeon]
MRKINLILIIILPFLIAANWYPVDKPDAKTTYLKNKIQCEQAESWDCFDITGMNLETHSLQDIEVDDYENPTYLKQNITSDLADLDSCYAEIAEKAREVNPISCQEIRDTGSDSEGNTVCAISMLPYCHLYGVKAVCNSIDLKYEAYCPVFSHYEKKFEKQLVHDASKQAAYDAIRDQKLAKKAVKLAAKTRLKDANIDGADLATLKNIIKDMRKVLSLDE